MKQIANWAPWIKERKLAEARAIANYNRQHFFSQGFFNQVVNELKINLTAGFKEQSQGSNFQPWIDRWTNLMSYPEITNFLTTPQHYKSPCMDSVNQVLSTAQNKLTKVANKNKR